MEGDGEAEGGGGGAVLLRQVLRDLAVLRVVHPLRVEVICAKIPTEVNKKPPTRGHFRDVPSARMEVAYKFQAEASFRETSSELGHLAHSSRGRAFQSFTKCASAGRGSGYSQHLRPT